MWVHVGSTPSGDQAVSGWLSWACIRIGLGRAASGGAWSGQVRSGQVGTPVRSAPTVTCSPACRSAVKMFFPMDRPPQSSVTFCAFSAHTWIMWPCGCSSRLPSPQYTPSLSTHLSGRTRMGDRRSGGRRGGRRKRRR